METGTFPNVTQGQSSSHAVTRVPAAGLMGGSSQLQQVVLMCCKCSDNTHIPQCWWPAPVQLPPSIPGELRVPVGVGDDAVLHGGGPAQRHEDQHAPPAEHG